MSFLGLEIGDVTLAAIVADGGSFSTPACALLEPTGAVYGEEARSAARSRPGFFHDRYWSNLAEQALRRPAAGMETLADLAHGQLQSLWNEHGEGISAVGCAVPVDWQREQLALFLGIAEELCIPVTHLVPMPVAATRRACADSQLLHVEAGRYTTQLCEMSQDGGASVASTLALDGFGLAALERSSADYFARCFLEHSRFDPMYDADCEQLLYDRMPVWIDTLRRDGTLQLTLEQRGNEFTARASYSELADRQRARCQPLIQAVRNRASASTPCALQLTAGLATVPGLAETLADIAGCEVLVLEPAAAARGLTERREGFAAGAGGVGLTEKLPFDQATLHLDMERALATRAGQMPTHMLAGDQVYRLGKTTLRIGAEAVEGGYNLVIDSRHSGVSRKHCSVECVNGQLTLSDHSRFGTRLNGHKVTGAVVLQAGDVISMGDPVCELRLLSETGPAE